MAKHKVLLYAKKQAPQALEIKKLVAEALKSDGVATIDATSSDTPLKAAVVGDVRLAVVFGGDGTLLRLVRRMERKDAFPILGVNLGSLGFITDIAPDDAVQAVRNALAAKLPESPRRLLEVDLFRGRKKIATGYAFNDAVLTKDARTPMLKFDVHIDGEHLSYVRADGYIVSTSTGSTAYNLSVGGPLLYPEVPAFVVAPICSHSLSSRPVVVPASATMEIVPRELLGKTYLVFDGQVSHGVENGDRIRIRSADRAVRLVRSPQQTWAQALRRKLEMS